MRAWPRIAAIGIACSTLAACSGGDNGPPACPNPPDAGDLPCDVSAVLVAKCQPCHRQPPKNHAPFPEVTFEDLEQPFGNTGLRRWQRMAQVIVPGDKVQMPPSNYPQLTSSELATLLNWFAACAPPQPEGTSCDGVDGGAPAVDAAVDASSD